MKIKRLITDNGSAYRSKLFAETCQALAIKHSFTKPYCPQTNGKAERFIQTCLREWPMDGFGPTVPNESRGCHPSWPTTTSGDHTQPSATALQPPACLGTTC